MGFVEREREETKKVRETGKGEEHYLVHLSGRVVVQRDGIRRERTKKNAPLKLIIGLCPVELMSVLKT